MFILCPILQDYLFSSRVFCLKRCHGIFYTVILPKNRDYFIPLIDMLYISSFDFIVLARTTSIWKKSSESRHPCQDNLDIHYRENIQSFPSVH
jgi:hypothetical protein